MVWHTIVDRDAMAEAAITKTARVLINPQRTCSLNNVKTGSINERESLRKIS